MVMILIRSDQETDGKQVDGTIWVEGTVHLCRPGQTRGGGVSGGRWSERGVVTSRATV